LFIRGYAEYLLLVEGFEPGVKRNFWLHAMYACTN